MKFLKLTLAELKKIFLRPTFYILVACLLIAIIVSSFLFTPQERTSYKSAVSGETVSRIYNNFKRTSSPETDGAAFYSDKLEQEFEKIEKFNERNDLKSFQDSVSTFKSYFYQLEKAVETAGANVNHIANIYNCANELSSQLNAIEVSTQQFDFLIKTKDLQDFKNLIHNIQSTLPKAMSAIEIMPQEEMISLCKALWNNYKSAVDDMVATCTNLKKITLPQTFFEEIADFKTNVSSYLESKESKIDEFYSSKNEKNADPQTIIEFRDILSDYKAGAEVSLLALSNKLSLKMLQLSGDEINQYLGFEESSLYKLQEDTSFYTYIIENKIDYSKALTALNFDVNSGVKTNGYDFAYFMLAIASLILDLIVIYFACMLFSGERHDGQMRMNLTKPVSRYKLYFAKLCALLLLSFVSHLLLGLLLLAIGVCIYGTASGCVLISVFSSTSAFGVAPFGNYLLKMLSLFLTNAFYIVLSCFISVLFANPVFSVVISYLVYAFAITTNTLLSKFAFLKFLPFIHTDLSAFFGGGIWGNTFLGSLIYSGFSFPLSLIYFVVTVCVLIAASVTIFKRQEL